MNLNGLKQQQLNSGSDNEESREESPVRTPTKRAGPPDGDSPSKRSCDEEQNSSPPRGMILFGIDEESREESPVRTPTKRAGPPDGLFDVKTRQSSLEIGGDNTPPPSPNGMEEKKHGASTKGVVVSKHNGSFSPVTVLHNTDGCKTVEKRFYVAWKGVKSKAMSGLKTKCPEHNIMLWDDWLKNKRAHKDYSGPASMHFVKTYDITTIKDGGDYGLSIFEMTMEYVLPVLDFLSSNPDKMNELASSYIKTIANINSSLLEDGVVLEDIHPRNCGLRFLPDGTFELVFFDLQFSTIEKGINIPSEYVFEMTSDLTGNERKVLKKRQALLLMVESINRYDPVRPRKEHLQEIARELNIGCMSLEQVDLALGAFLS